MFTNSFGYTCRHNLFTSQNIVCKYRTTAQNTAITIVYVSMNIQLGDFLRNTSVIIVFEKYILACRHRIKGYNQSRHHEPGHKLPIRLDSG